MSFFFQLAIGVPFLVLFLYLFKLPESVRWSWAVGKFKTANKVILEMSRFNKVEVPKEFIMSEETEMHQLTTEGVGMAPLLASKVSFKVKMKSFSGEVLVLQSKEI